MYLPAAKIKGRLIAGYNAISKTIINYSKMAMCLTQLTYCPPEKISMHVVFKKTLTIYISHISIERLWNGEINKTVLLTAFLHVSGRSHLTAKVTEWNSDELIRYTMQSSIQITVQFIAKGPLVAYSTFTETGATQTMKTNQKAELKQYSCRFQHFQIQPIKCPVQNNEISTCSLTGDVYVTTVSVKCQAQTGRTFMCLWL